MAEFAASLERVNALADASPGFVWRLQTDAGDATAVRPFEDQNVIVNLSVWQDLESLRRYVYESGHLDVLRRDGPGAEAFDFRHAYPAPDAGS